MGGSTDVEGVAEFCEGLIFKVPVADVGEGVLSELALVAAEGFEVSTIVSFLPMLPQQSLLPLVDLDIDQRQTVFNRPSLWLRFVADSFADIIIDSTSMNAYSSKTLEVKLLLTISYSRSSYFLRLKLTPWKQCRSFS